MCVSSSPPIATRCPPNETRVEWVTGKLHISFHTLLRGGFRNLDPRVFDVRSSGREQVKTDLNGQFKSFKLEEAVIPPAR